MLFYAVLFRYLDVKKINFRDNKLKLYTLIIILTKVVNFISINFNNGHITLSSRLT